MQGHQAHHAPPSHISSDAARDLARMQLRDRRLAYHLWHRVKRNPLGHASGLVGDHALFVAGFGGVWIGYIHSEGTVILLIAQACREPLNPDLGFRIAFQNGRLILSLGPRSGRTVEVPMAGLRFPAIEISATIAAGLDRAWSPDSGPILLTSLDLSPHRKKKNDQMQSQSDSVSHFADQLG